MTYQPIRRESLAKRFKRSAARWKKTFRNEALVPEDLSKMTIYVTGQLGSLDKVIAQRNNKEKWDIIYGESFFGLFHEKFKSLSNLSLGEALDYLHQNYPAGMKRYVGRDHPATIAKQIGHVFKDKPPKPKEKRPPPKPFKL